MTLCSLYSWLPQSLTKTKMIGDEKTLGWLSTSLFVPPPTDIRHGKMKEYNLTASTPSCWLPHSPTNTRMRKDVHPTVCPSREDVRHGKIQEWHLTASPPRCRPRRSSSTTRRRKRKETSSPDCRGEGMNTRGQCRWRRVAGAGCGYAFPEGRR